MGQPKIWDLDDGFLPDVQDIHEGDLGKKSVNGDGRAPFTLLTYEDGDWVDFFPRLDENGKVQDVNLSASVPILDGDGMLPDANLSANVPILDGDGKLSLNTFPGQIINLIRTFPDITVHPSDGANTSGTTLVDSGLSAAVEGDGYITSLVRARILYSAGSSVGARFSLNGPAKNRIAYKSVYGLTATTETVNYCNDYDQPAAANASSPYANFNVAIIEGIVRPTTPGNIVVRFASAGGGTIAILEGSELAIQRFTLVT